MKCMALNLADLCLVGSETLELLHLVDRRANSSVGLCTSDDSRINSRFHTYPQLKYQNMQLPVSYALVAHESGW